MSFVFPMQGVSISPQYRNGGGGPGGTEGGGAGGGGGPQSPTSPLSQHSYSPSQSPHNLSPSNVSGTSFADAYYQHQQLQANALQHQFEQFNMVSKKICIFACLLVTPSVSNPSKIALGVMG